MTITNAAGAIGIGATSTTVVCSVASVPAGADIILFVQNRTNETAVISSVSDTVNGSWSITPISGPHDLTGASAQRSWVLRFPASAAGSPTITVTFDAAINSQADASWLSSDLGALTLQGAAAVAEASSAATTLASNTLSVPSAGCVLGGLFTGNAQSDPEPTADTGESRLTAGAAGGRTFIFYEAVAGGSSYGLTAVAMDSTVAVFHLVGFVEPGGGGAVARNNLALLGLGR